MRVVIPKHLSTSLVDVDIHPTYVSVIIKSKILRVVLPVEVLSDKSVARRSAVTGNLELVMPKADTSEGVIGLGLNMVDHDGKLQKTMKGSSGCSNSSTTMGPGINENATLKKRECLGQSLLNDAGGVHLLNIVRNQGFDATNAADRCCDDDDDDDDEPPALS
jgi:protein TilB